MYIYGEIKNVCKIRSIYAHGNSLSVQYFIKNYIIILLTKLFLYILDNFS